MQRFRGGLVFKAHRLVYDLVHRGERVRDAPVLERGDGRGVEARAVEEGEGPERLISLISI